MKIQVFQHVPFEGPGTIAPFLEASGKHQINIVHLYRGELFGAIDSDLLVVMGGPMGVDDEKDYPWLIEEKRAIARQVEAGKKVLGICLGAQLIASVMGASVRPMGYREIGWFPVETDPQWQRSWSQGLFPDRFEPLHWHGDTFEVPAGAMRIGSSSACENQGFVVDEQIVALQFHLEFGVRSVQRLARAVPEELDDTSFVQNEEHMLRDEKKFAEANGLMQKLLGRLCT
jgi:GMP synthase-like glutamine amidotransferase